MYELNYFNKPRTEVPLATFEEGKVYYADRRFLVGTYDQNGNVYRNDGCLIGQVTNERVIMDRYYRYNQWLDSLSRGGDDLKGFVEEIKTIHQNCMPYTQLRVANIFGGWIEDLDETDKTDYYGDPADVIGSGAAVLLLIEDQLVEDKRFKFYRNLQEEFYFRLKIKKETNSSDLLKYLKYFDELYGEYPGTGYCG